MFDHTCADEQVDLGPHAFAWIFSEPFFRLKEITRFWYLSHMNTCCIAHVQLSNEDIYLFLIDPSFSSILRVFEQKRPWCECADMSLNLLFA